MHNRYPRSIIFALCLSLIVAVAATILVNAHQSAGDAVHDKARSHPATMTSPRTSGVL